MGNSDSQNDGGSAEAVLSEAAKEADYAQFARRDLDKMSWLAPLVNNRVGELLRIQLRHEHLFFIKDERVVDEIGFGETGKRFRERDMGKAIATPAEMRAEGYWLIQPRLDAASAFEAVSETCDGAYYSVFSNQCQDWAWRVRKRALQVQKQNGIAAPEVLAEDKVLLKRVPPTVPAAWYLGVLAILAGVLGLQDSLGTGLNYIRFVALLLVGVGVSDVMYSFASSEWRTLVSTSVLGMLNAFGGLVLWLNTYWVAEWSNVVLALVCVAVGLARVLVALRSRPLVAWSGTLLSGICFLVVGWIAWNRRGTDGAVLLLGWAISISFLAAGISTVWLNYKLRKGQ